MNVKALLNTEPVKGLVEEALKSPMSSWTDDGREFAIPNSGFITVKVTTRKMAALVEVLESHGISDQLDTPYTHRYSFETGPTESDVHYSFHIKAHTNYRGEPRGASVTVRTSPYTWEVPA
jgi:hypothetical protein